MKIIIIGLLIIFNYSIFAQKTINNDKWIEDLELFKTELPKKHKNLFFQIKQTEFDSLINSIEDSIVILSDIDIVLKMEQIISKIGDAHTSIYSDILAKNANYFPFSYNWFADSLRVVKCTKEYKNLIGCKLISINNVPVQIIIDKLKDFFVAENDALVKTFIPNLLLSDIYLRYLKILTDNNPTMTFVDLNGNKIVENVKLLSSWEPYTEEIRIKNNPYYLQHKYKKFWQTYIKQDSTIFIQYNQCISKEVTKELWESQKSSFQGIRKIMLKLYIMTLPSFSKLEKKVNKEIETKNTKKIIIDLRFNSGGNSYIGTQFAKNLSKYNDVKFYVIIGRSTYSSAIINAYDFKNKINAVLIGEPTSGKPNHFGEVKGFFLSNSKINIYYSTNYFQNSEQNINTLVPDKVILLNYSDYLKGIDPVYEYIKGN